MIKKEKNIKLLKKGIKNLHNFFRMYILNDNIRREGGIRNWKEGENYRNQGALRWWRRVGAGISVIGEVTFVLREGFFDWPNTHGFA